MFNCLKCFDTGRVSNYSSDGELRIRCNCKQRYNLQNKELNFIADLTNNDIHELIDLSLVLKDIEMFEYYVNRLKG